MHAQNRIVTLRIFLNTNEKIPGASRHSTCQCSKKNVSKKRVSERGIFGSEYYRCEEDLVYWYIRNILRGRGEMREDYD